MAKKATNKVRDIALGDLRAHQLRTVEVAGLLPDGGTGTIHYRAFSARKMLEYMERAQDAEMTDAEKFVRTVRDLSELLVTPEGEPFASEDDLMELPADALTAMLGAIANRAVETAGGGEGNASSGAPGSDSPTG